MHSTRPVRRLMAPAAVLAMLAVMLPLIVTGTGSAAPLFHPPVKLSVSNSIGEPGIDISDDGTIFVNGILGLPVRSKLWRSDNGGSTFTNLTFTQPYNRLPGGGDADVITAPGGRVYYLDLWAGSNSIARSEDDGQTWIEGSPFTTLPVSDRQWVALGPRDPETGRDTLYVIYRFINPPSTVMFARSTDGGLTWSWHTGPLGPASPGGTYPPGQLVSDGDKFLAFPYERGGAIWVVTSTDGGTTWRRTQATFNGASVTFGLISLALDGNNLYATYLDRNDYSIRVVRSTDRGVNWDFTPSEILTGGTNMFPWVTARGGKVAVAWYHADNATDDPNNAPAGTEWRVYYSESLDGDTFTQPVAAASHIVKKGFICTKGLDCDAGRELGDFLQLAIDAGGKSLITYVSASASPGAYVVKQQ